MEGKRWLREKFSIQETTSKTNLFDCKKTQDAKPNSSIYKKLRRGFSMDENCATSEQKRRTSIPKMTLGVLRKLRKRLSVDDGTSSHDFTKAQVVYDAKGKGLFKFSANSDDDFDVISLKELDTNCPNYDVFEDVNVKPLEFHNYLSESLDFLGRNIAQKHSGNTHDENDKAFVLEYNKMQEDQVDKTQMNALDVDTKALQTREKIDLLDIRFSFFDDNEIPYRKCKSEMNIPNSVGTIKTRSYDGCFKSNQIQHDYENVALLKPPQKSGSLFLTSVEIYETPKSLVNLDEEDLYENIAFVKSDCKVIERNENNKTSAIARETNEYEEIERNENNQISSKTKPNEYEEIERNENNQISSKTKPNEHGEIERNEDNIISAKATLNKCEEIERHDFTNSLAKSKSLQNFNEANYRLYRKTSCDAFIIKNTLNNVDLFKDLHFSSYKSIQFDKTNPIDEHEHDELFDYEEIDFKTSVIQNVKRSRSEIIFRKNIQRTNSSNNQAKRHLHLKEEDGLKVEDLESKENNCCKSDDYLIWTGKAGMANHFNNSIHEINCFKLDESKMNERQIWMMENGIAANHSNNNENYFKLDDSKMKERQIWMSENGIAANHSNNNENCFKFDDSKIKERQNWMIETGIANNNMPEINYSKVYEISNHPNKNMQEIFDSKINGTSIHSNNNMQEIYGSNKRVHEINCLTMDDSKTKETNQHWNNAHFPESTSRNHSNESHETIFGNPLLETKYHFPPNSSEDVDFEHATVPGRNWSNIKTRLTKMLAHHSSQQRVGAFADEEKVVINLEGMYRSSKENCKCLLKLPIKLFQKRKSKRNDDCEKRTRRKFDEYSVKAKSETFLCRGLKSGDIIRDFGCDGVFRSRNIEGIKYSFYDGTNKSGFNHTEQNQVDALEIDYTNNLARLEGQNGFDDLRRYVKQGGDFCKELSTILQERYEAEIQYSKSLSKLSVKLSRACREGVGGLNEAWKAVAVELEARAEAHRQMGVILLEETARPLRNLNENQHRSRKHSESVVDKAARVLADWRAAEAKSKKHSHACARDNEKLQDAMLDTRLSRTTSLIQLPNIHKTNTDKDSAKLEGKKRKAEDAVKKADIEYYSHCVRSERARLEWESAVLRGAATFQTLEEERLNNLKSILTCYLKHSTSLTPKLAEATEKIRTPVEDGEPQKDITTFISLRQSSQQTAEQLLPDFYCEHITLAMNRERRKQALVKLLQLIKQDIDRERKSKDGLENLSKAIKNTPTFGSEDSQQTVTEKLYHMKSMLTYLEGARYKVQSALAELDCRPRNGHPLASHITITRDKAGLQQSVLKVPQWLREQWIETDKTIFPEKKEDADSDGDTNWIDRGMADGNSNQPDSDFDEFSSQGSSICEGICPTEENPVQPIAQCKVLYTYTPNLPDELSIRPGDTVSVYRQQEDGWWLGECNGAVGIFPATYVETIST